MSKKQLRDQKKVEKANQKAGNTEFKCNVCGAVFDSKTKLFKHIKATGHALRV